MPAWWESFDAARSCLYDDYRDYNKKERMRLYDEVSAGVPGAQQKLDAFVEVDELQFKKLRLIAGCPVEQVQPKVPTGGKLPTMIGIKGIGPAEFDYTPPDETGDGYQPTIEEIVSDEPVAEIVGDPSDFIFSVDPNVPPGTDGSVPADDVVLMDDWSIPAGTDPADGSATDIGLRLPGEPSDEPDGALVPERVGPGFDVSVARPAQPVVWAAALAGATAVVVAGAYLLSKLSR